MGRQWCRDEPPVEIDGVKYACIVGVDGDARESLEGVTVEVRYKQSFEEQGEKHRLLGTPIDVTGVQADEVGATLYIASGDTSFPCTISLVPRGNAEGAEYFGAGYTNEHVEAGEVVGAG